MNYDLPPLIELYQRGRQGGIGLQTHGDERAFYRQAKGFGARLLSDGNPGQSLVAGKFDDLYPRYECKLA